MRLNILSIADVVDSDLCCGCGACAAASEGAIEMIDALDHGRRPRARDGVIAPAIEDRLLRLCPGIALAHENPPPPAAIESVRAGFGPVLEVWEGHAGAADVRFRGSSGGAVTALAAHGLEQAGWHGVLHIAARPDAPHLNETVLSRTTNELRGRSGSRYAPASPCDGLDRIEKAPDPCGFVGKPCDVAAAHRAAAQWPALGERLALTISLFCAGTPTTRGTLEMLQRMGIDDPATLTELRYRGRGWPGPTTATTGNGRAAETRRISYEEAWGSVLTKHKQWRCRLCPDHTGEFADIAVGDPWYQPIEPDEPGRSLIVVRTERGRAFLHDAMRAGAIVAWPVGPDVLEASQPELIRARGMAWGRRLAMRLMGLPVPRFDGLPMFRFWWSRTGASAKFRSILGTMRWWRRRRQRGPALETMPGAPGAMRDAPIGRLVPEDPSLTRRAA
ncbi:MAG: Coenzyme F420 hydrogenase/dehydrogenase, beta subunit C-terminal domain [Planctomycetota bacterium]|jgi:coenzyme F420 hydrogenase subunit beta